MKNFRLASVVYLLILAFIYVGYVVYPLAETVRESLQVNGEFSFANYVDILNPTNSANVEAVWNSVLVSLLSFLFSCIVGVFFAFVLTQCDFPFRKFLSRLAILPIALPPLVGVIAFLFVFGESGILPRVVEKLIGLSGSSMALDGLSAIVAIHSYSFYVYFYLFVSTALRNLDASQIEAAQVLGCRVLREGRSGFDARIEHLYRIALSRRPQPEEIGELKALFSEQLTLCRNNPETAGALIGDQTMPEGIDSCEAAAWIGLARTILNLDEFITRQ